MNKYKEILSDYNMAYINLRNNARKALEDYGKELDIESILRKAYLKENNLIPENLSEDEDIRSEYLYYCTVETKHAGLYPAFIYKAAWDDDWCMIKVYVKSEDNYIDDWFYESYITDDENIYISVLEALNNVPD